MAEKQLTTIEQLRALAERGKQDTLIRINELLDFPTRFRLVHDFDRLDIGFIKPSPFPRFGAVIDIDAGNSLWLIVLWENIILDNAGQNFIVCGDDSHLFSFE